MSSKPWFAWFPADYRAKTAHLTFEQDSAYRRLLDAYYERRGPLPCDMQALYRITGAQSLEERKAVSDVASEFFTNGNGFLRHARCDSQIAKEAELRAKWSESGRKGGLLSAQGRLKAGFKGASTIPSPHPHSSPDLSLQKSKALASPDEESGSAVELIPLVGKQEWPVPGSFVAELERAYPAVDGVRTLREIRAWCLSNPEKRKTYRGVKRFINRWFEKEQNRG